MARRFETSTVPSWFADRIRADGWDDKHIEPMYETVADELRQIPANTEQGRDLMAFLAPARLAHERGEWPTND